MGFHYPISGGGSGSITIGDAVSGGAPYNVLQIDASGNLTQALQIYDTNGYEVFSFNDITAGPLQWGDIGGNVNGTLVSLDDTAQTLTISANAALIYQSTSGSEYLYLGSDDYKMGDISANNNGTYFNVHDSESVFNFWTGVSPKLIAQIDFTHGLVLFGSTSGNATFIGPDPSTALWGMVLPPAQGGANTYLKNDGSGNMTWTNGQLPHSILTIAASAVTLLNNTYNIINNVGTLVALTINFPAMPANNDVVEVKFDVAVTTATYAAPGGATVKGGIVSPVLGAYTKFTYDTATTTWY